MKRVLSGSQIRTVDQLTTDICGIPGLLLMENAAIRVVEEVEERYGRLAGKRVVIVCGKGNNGGDGAAIGRMMWLRDARVEIYLLGEMRAALGDARVNFEIASKLSSAMESVRGPALAMKVRPPHERAGGSIAFREVAGDAQLFSLCDALAEFDLVIDAIFGTGLSKPAEGKHRTIIERINDLDPAKVIAVDIPSGLHADRAKPVGPHVRAGLTVTMTAAKPANVLAPAAFASDALAIASIGTPSTLLDDTGSRLYSVERSDIETYLSQTARSRNAHKGSQGRVLVIAGSRGKTGAACLTAEAALRAGCGLVTLATAASSQQVVARRSIAEIMTESLDETAGGTISKAASGHAMELIDKSDIVALGPGISSNEETQAFVGEIAKARRVPLVIDADGLNCLAPWPAEIRGSAEFPLILTPHPGEMSRLTQIPAEDILAQPVEVARDFACAHEVILVLKGARTLIASPDGAVYVNSTGNPGMATGGAGDVLTGIIAGLLAQSPQNALGAAIAGVYLHGLAGDLAKKQVGERALLASDITACLIEALRVFGA